MMKKALSCILSLIFIFVLSALAFAGQRQITGKVIAVDEAANTITINGRKGDITVSVEKNTKIIKEIIKKFRDVKINNKVTVKYTEADGNFTAKKITVRAKKYKPRGN
jgi:maltose-binding protein MalE